MSHTDKFECKQCGVKVTLKHDVFRAEMFDNLCGDCWISRGGIYYEKPRKGHVNNKSSKRQRAMGACG